MSLDHQMMMCLFVPLKTVWAKLFVLVSHGLAHLFLVLPHSPPTPIQHPHPHPPTPPPLLSALNFEARCPGSGRSLACPSPSWSSGAAPPHANPPPAGSLWVQSKKGDPVQVGFKGNKRLRGFETKPYVSPKKTPQQEGTFRNHPGFRRIPFCLCPLLSSFDRLPACFLSTPK